MVRHVLKQLHHSGSTSTRKVWSFEWCYFKHPTTRTDPFKAFRWRTDVVKLDFIHISCHIVHMAPDWWFFWRNLRQIEDTFQGDPTVVPPVRRNLHRFAIYSRHFPATCQNSIHFHHSTNVPRLLSSATGSLEDEMVLPSGEHSEHLEAHYLFLASCDQSPTALNPWFRRTNHGASGSFVWLSSLEDVFWFRYLFWCYHDSANMCQLADETWHLEERLFNLFHVFSWSSALYLLGRIKIDATIAADCKCFCHEKSWCGVFGGWSEKIMTWITCYRLIISNKSIVYMIRVPRKNNSWYYRCYRYGL